MRNTVYALTVCLCLALFLSACARRAPQASPVPQDAGIVVAAFNQPVLTSQLLTGQLPERQGRIAPNLLRVLDGDLAQALHARQRLYTALPSEALPTDSVHESATSQGLQHWLRVGRAHKARLLLVPQILDWHEREGSRAGVTRGAHVRMELFLLDVPQGRVLRRAIFDEQQVGLADDMTKIGRFFKRRGAWVEAHELAREGMGQALGELGL